MNEELRARALIITKSRFYGGELGAAQFGADMRFLGATDEDIDKACEEIHAAWAAERERQMGRDGEQIRYALMELRKALTAAGIDTPVALALQDAASATKFARLTGMRHRGEIVQLPADFMQVGSCAGVAVLYKSDSKRPFES